MKTEFVGLTEVSVRIIFKAAHASSHEICIKGSVVHFHSRIVFIGEKKAQQYCTGEWIVLQSSEQASG